MNLLACPTCEDDIVGLQQSHENMAKTTKVPSADEFSIGTILKSMDNENVYLVEIMLAIAGYLTLRSETCGPVPRHSKPF